MAIEHPLVCPRCGLVYELDDRWTLCPHPKRRPVRPTQPGLAAAGTARPARPTQVFAEDFSLLIRAPKRLRLARGTIRVLN